MYMTRTPGSSAPRSAVSGRRGRGAAQRAGRRTHARSLASLLMETTRRAVAPRGMGVATFLCICEPVGSAVKCHCAGKGRFVRGKRASTAKPVAASTWRSLLARHDWSPLASILRAAGAVERLRMLALLAAGCASYGQLRRLTGQKPGPLYHHLNCLRLAGLVTLEARDRYSATYVGRRAVLALLACGELIKRGHEGRG